MVIEEYEKELMFKNEIISFIGNQECEKIAHKVVRELQNLKNCTLSGDDSGLQNVWDEICVQVQYEESFEWEIYVDLIKKYISDQLESLKSELIKAMWLETEEGDMYDWNEDKGWNEDAVVEYILREHILSAADTHSNDRIRRFLNE